MPEEPDYNMLQQFIQFITEQHLFSTEQEVLLAVSGGRDSVVLCHLMQRAGYHYAIAHCNFHLRPGDSDRDEIFVRELAQQYGVPCHVAQFYTRDTAAQAGTGIEEQARAERYAFFARLLQHENYACVATAHHQDDSIETFFLNLLRGTGIRGLHGIRPISSGPAEIAQTCIDNLGKLNNLNDHTASRGHVVHPLLCFSRKEIDNYVAKHNLPYVEDYTNQLPDYRRNRIRLQLLPLLRSLSPAFDSTMVANIQRFADAETLYRQAVEHTRRQLLLPLIGNHPDCYSLSVAALQQLQPQRTLLFELLSPFGFSMGVVEDVANGLRHHTRQEFRSTTHRMCRERDRLVIEPLAHLVDTGEVLSLPHITATNAPTANIPVALPNTTLQWVVSTCLPLQHDTKAYKLPPTKACFDLNKLQQPLHLRHWRDGDKFRPFGMKGSKLVSDYFSDNKFSQQQKETTWLLCDATDRILWIVGHRAASLAAISEPTQQIIIFTLSIE